MLVLSRPRSLVVLALAAGIHVFRPFGNIKAWMAGTRGRSSPAVAAELVLLQLRRFLGVVPPSVRDTPEIARLGDGEPKCVPIGDPVRRFVPMRNPIAAGAKHS